MKKILFAFSMIFALVSCVSEDLPQTSIPQEGDKVTLTFGVQIPEAGVATRSMADPAITSLNLLVFDQNGYLVETAQAYVGGSTSWTDKTTPTTPPTATQKFTVTLTKTSAYRAIHFVANADVSGLANFGHEDALIPSLVSTGTDDAYWQRMEFANGIASDSGTKLDNNTVVPLVRNFAKVTVTESLSNFVLEGFVVMNTRSEGTVAAYNAREREFAEFVNGTTARAYSAMIAEYNGFEAGVQQNTKPADAAFTTGAKYVRETAAGATDGTNPYIIVKGKWVASGTPTDQTESKYYRLDFVNASGTSGLAAILRNFSYNFNITSVEKAGMSLDEVMNATEGENNLSFQEATQSLLNISDGTGQLFVSATNVTLVSNEPYILMYKYVSNISNGTVGTASYSRKETYNADRSAFESTYYDSAKSGTIDDAFINAQDASMRDYYKEFKGYSYITLLPSTPQPNTLNDVIVITGGELAREVRFTLQQKIDMTVEAYDGNVGVEDNEVARATGEKVWVDITIPANLSQYIFPLEFEIEAGALSIYPDANPNTSVTTAERNNMPVRTGATIIPGQSGNTFRFVRTLSLEEYNALKTAANGAETVTFTSQFLTNKAANESQVYVANHYFNTGFDEDGGFENPTITYATELIMDNINKATATYEWLGTKDCFNDNNQEVTIYTANNETIATRTFSSSGPTNTASIDVSSWNLTEDATIYFSFSVQYLGTYSASIKVSELNAPGANITLNFTRN